VENYFQWSEVDEDGDVKIIIGEAQVDNPEPNENAENCKEKEVLLNDGVRLTEESSTDGKETLPNLTSSTQEDVEYHIKHCECL
jgi:hypothetical protein